MKIGVMLLAALVCCRRVPDVERLDPPPAHTQSDEAQRSQPDQATEGRQASRLMSLRQEVYAHALASGWAIGDFVPDAWEVLDDITLEADSRLLCIRWNPLLVPGDTLDDLRTWVVLSPPGGGATVIARGLVGVMDVLQSLPASWGEKRLAVLRLLGRAMRPGTIEPRGEEPVVSAAAAPDDSWWLRVSGRVGGFEAAPYRPEFRVALRGQGHSLGSCEIGISGVNRLQQESTRPSLTREGIAQLLDTSPWNLARYGDDVGDYVSVTRKGRHLAGEGVVQSVVRGSGRAQYFETTIPRADETSPAVVRGCTERAPGIGFVGVFTTDLIGNLVGLALWLDEGSEGAGQVIRWALQGSDFQGRSLGRAPVITRLDGSGTFMVEPVRADGTGGCLSHANATVSIDAKGVIDVTLQW